MGFKISWKWSGEKLDYGGAEKKGARQKSSEVGTPRCGVRTAQRAVPTGENKEADLRPEKNRAQWHHIESNQWH